MRGYAAAGVLLAVGLILMWAGFAGKAGGVLAALFAPQALLASDAPGTEQG